MTHSGEAARPATGEDLSLLANVAATHAAGLADQRGGPLFLLNEVADQQDFSTWFHSLLADPEALVLTGTYDGVPFGYCAAKLVRLADGTRLARISALLVDAAARESGIGEALMVQAVAWARSHGCVSIDASALPGDRSTKNFFESFGLKARLLTVNLDLSSTA